jgi:hypothetical protein
VTSIQILKDAFLAVVLLIGAAAALTAAMETAAALWKRQSRQAGLRAVEQHLASAAGDAVSAGQG